ncbi:unnamed protein product [Fusarium graminearum]|uniref:Uncharacterized protein n=1 Tax=Gibberella zeae TaxID=5518 RepID=A0A4U9EM98_GIBZA|nr:unnamed protein product [Fusarium graminearum]CAG1974812.1 unnamed protein product [Fusarium graminearum]VTO84238.1 unnamed protein product [Fusarium graminearum]
MSAEELEEWNSEECEFRWITTLVTRENHLVQRPYSRFIAGKDLGSRISIGEFVLTTHRNTESNYSPGKRLQKEPDGAIPPLEVADADAHIREAPLGRPTDYKRCQASGL